LWILNRTFANCSIPTIADHPLQTLKAGWWDLVDGTDDNIIVFVHNILGTMNWTQEETKHCTKAFFGHLNKIFISNQHYEIKFSFYMENCHQIWFKNWKISGKMRINKRNEKLLCTTTYNF
jgi:hypothetical protein